MTTCLACRENTFDPEPGECTNAECPRNREGWSLPGVVVIAATVATLFALVVRL